MDSLGYLTAVRVGCAFVGSLGDGSTKPYDAAEPEQIAVIDSLDAEAYSAAFSHDGSLLAVAGTDGPVFLWDVSDPAQPEQIGDPITGPVGRTFDLSFHPDGHTLAATVIDVTIWTWDITDPAKPERQAVHGPIRGVVLFGGEYTPDGTAIVGAGSDGLVRRWELDEEAVIDDICASVGDPITEEEWSTYLPDRPYEPPCA